MKSANNEPTTARNTPNPIFAGGRDEVLCSRKSAITPSSSQGLAASRLLREPPSRNCRYSSHEQDNGAHGWAPCADNPAGGSFCGTKSLVAPGTL